MKITENIKSLIESIQLLSQLDGPEFITEQWLSEEDRFNIAVELWVIMQSQKEEAKSYVEYKLRERQEQAILAEWTAQEIKRLQELQKSYNNKIEKNEKWIDYVLQTFQIDKMETPIAKLSYRDSQQVTIIDESIIPIQYFTIKETKSLDKTGCKVYLKNGTEIPWLVLKTIKNLQIK